MTVRFIPVCREGFLRLADRTFTTSGGIITIGGAVQVCANQRYVYVCADDNWDDRQAEMACRRLGYQAPYYGMRQYYKAQT